MELIFQKHSLRRRDAGVDTPLAEDVDHQSAASVETSSNVSKKNLMNINRRDQRSFIFQLFNQIW